MLQGLAAPPLPRAVGVQSITAGRGSTAPLTTAATSRIGRLARLVAALAADGAIAEAVELCLDAGAHGLASDLVLEARNDEASALTAAELSALVDRLPADERRRLDRCNGAADGSSDLAPPGAAAPLARVTLLPSAVDQAPDTIHVQLRVLSELDVAIDGTRVTSWRGRQGRALLAYLALHAPRTVGRDALAEAFWPDAAPSVSRNRLNVALHGLRLDLRDAHGEPLIVYRNGYGFSADVDVRIDVVEFEREIADARKAVAAGRPADALAHYRVALDTYRDDLLPELPYEEWTIVRREHLRVAMLDALSFVAEQTFADGDYAACIDAAQRLVAVDLCREDVHRTLMRAFARLDQPHRAIRQYRACLRQLGSELGVDPRPETVRLYEQIRSRQPV